MYEQKRAQIVRAWNEVMKSQFFRGIVGYGNGEQNAACRSIRRGFCTEEVGTMGEGIFFSSLDHL